MKADYTLDDSFWKEEDSPIGHSCLTETKSLIGDMYNYEVTPSRTGGRSEKKNEMTT
ncbi:hypothetical protein RUM44_006280 [Polyplax serrata]|uniref:Uncharacterized protein n=1 Tax=Polyplax serrata TaxID=468196 RepID=A0ABR1AHN6_POLSC